MRVCVCIYFGHASFAFSVRLTLVPRHGFVSIIPFHSVCGNTSNAFNSKKQRQRRQQQQQHIIATFVNVYTCGICVFCIICDCTHCYIIRISYQCVRLLVKIYTYIYLYILYIILCTFQPKRIRESEIMCMLRNMTDDVCDAMGWDGIGWRR